MNANADDATLTIGPAGRRAPPLRGFIVPALTILWHPDLERVGEVTPLTAALETDDTDLTRTQPAFFVPGSIIRRPIDHLAMNRNPVLRLTLRGGDLVLEPGIANKKVELEGEPFVQPRRLDRAELRRGLIFTVGRGFAFCIHEIQFPISRAQDLGLLGGSDAIEKVRREITGVPDDETLVFLRGESGTGKELAARALHESSGRSKGPFITINAGTLNASTAASVLFGHERGAFTGATDAKPGYFRAAHGGTLFVDEIGFMPYEVQPHLLRVLQDSCVPPLGSPRQQKVDVRVIAATDLPLEKAVNEGLFVRSLYNRLINGVTIKLPPLRKRREDIGVLLVHYLRQQFGGSAKLQRIQASHADGTGWLSPQTVATIASSALPANVRDLQGLAKALRSCVGTGAPDTSVVVAERLALFNELASTPTSPAPSPGDKNVRDLAAALQATGWDRKRAVKLLDISKATFYRDLKAHPDVHRLFKLSTRKLARELEACGGDVGRLAKKLQVPEVLLAQRLTKR
jgi:two-component system, NtrC family, nitrogen regulation response regulator GlnG